MTFLFCQSSKASLQWRPSRRSMGRVSWEEAARYLHLLIRNLMTPKCARTQGDWKRVRLRMIWKDFAKVNAITRWNKLPKARYRLVRNIFLQLRWKQTSAKSAKEAEARLSCRSQCTGERAKARLPLSSNALTALKSKMTTCGSSCSDKRMQ